jgi:hypothetical protein
MVSGAIIMLYILKNTPKPATNRETVLVTGGLGSNFTDVNYESKLICCRVHRITYGGPTFR